MKNNLNILNEIIKFFIGDSKETPITQDLKNARQGDASAQYKVGLHYYKGKIVPQDFKQAMQWFQKAADQNEAGGQFKLGQCYLFGKGVKKDIKQAMIWLQKAADQNHPGAQFVLGHQYAEGDSVKQDLSEATALWRQSLNTTDPQIDAAETEELRHTTLVRLYALYVCGADRNLKESITVLHQINSTRLFPSQQRRRKRNTSKENMAAEFESTSPKI